jgi:hypothetical protein
VHLRPADDDPVVVAFDDAHVEVGVLLRRGELAAGTLDVGLRDRQREAGAAAGMGDDVLDPLAAVVDLATVAEPLQVFLCRAHQRESTALRHRVTSAVGALDRPREVDA